MMKLDKPQPFNIITLDNFVEKLGRISPVNYRYTGVDFSFFRDEESNLYFAYNGFDHSLEVSRSLVFEPLIEKYQIPRAVAYQIIRCILILNYKIYTAPTIIVKLQ